jgi:ketosteroid isomerase-like protein
MSQENVELARRAYAAFNRGDSEGMVADIAPDLEYVTTGAIPGVGGVYPGPEGLRRFLAGLTFEGRGKQSGVDTAWDIWHV